jgi:dihydroorotate dehydrogenase electron transfer subunit
MPVGRQAPSAQRTARWTSATARVLAHERTGPDWLTLTLHAPEIAGLALPGHFVQVLVPCRGPAGVPFLRRPLSVCTADRDRGTVRLVYRVVGVGTRALAEAEPGETLDVLGPLGRSFPDPGRPEVAGRPLLLVGGGLGIPPLAAAAAWARGAGRPTVAFLGARSCRDLAGAREVEATGVPVVYATEDGSRGHQGLVTELLRAHLAAQPGSEVWACGPAAMLRAVQALCPPGRHEAWLLLERPMACGFGVCLGCPVARRGAPGYLRCCVDGPVFPADEVDPAD